MTTSYLKTLLQRAILWLTLFVAPAMAGPPLLCHPFETADAPTLPWGGDGWNQPALDFPLDQLAERTETLLTADTPVIARMETLRRAAIYASRDGQIAGELARRLDARIGAAGAEAKALALFDHGYYLETLQDVVRLHGYDMPGLGRTDVSALRELIAPQDGRVLIDQALELRADDPALRFAAALVAAADGRKADEAEHGRLARLGSDHDRLLALNLAQIAR